MVVGSAGAGRAVGDAATRDFASLLYEIEFENPVHACAELWIAEGVPRDFAHPPPDLIVLNEGTNDGCDTTSPGCNGTDISALMASVPATW